MKKIGLILLLIISVFCEEKKTRLLTDLEQEKFKRIKAEAENYQIKLRELQQEQDTLIISICGSVGVSSDKIQSGCSVNSKEVTNTIKEDVKK